MERAPTRVNTRHRILGTMQQVLFVVLAMGFAVSVHASAAQQDADSAQESSQVSQGSAASFYNDIRPILQRRCWGCHQPAKKGGDLVLTTYETFQTGGTLGEAFVPGQSDESVVIDHISGEEPLMPKEGPPLTPEEVELFRRWIAQGAEDDSPPEEPDPISPENPPVYRLPPVITAMAYSPDGQYLAVSGYREVLLHKADGSELLRRLVGLSPRIGSLVFHPEGKILAAVGGAPAQFGEVQFWEPESGELINSVTFGYDTLFGASFSPDGSKLAFGAADNSVQLIAVPEGKFLLKMDHHTDWVLGTAWSTKGTHLLSAGRDRALRLCNAETGEFIDNVNQLRPHLGDYLQAVVRHPTEEKVLIVGGERVPRLYQTFRTRERVASDEDFNLVRAYEKQPGSLSAADWSPDGKKFVVSGDEGIVRVYETESGKRLLDLKGHSGHVFAVAYHPKGHQIASGGFDGKVRIHDANDGHLVAEFVPVPLTQEVAQAE